MTVEVAEARAQAQPERIAHTEAKGRVFKVFDLAASKTRQSCIVLPSGATVRVDAQTAYAPDAVVYCGAKLDGDATEVPTPVIVVEVLSPSTQHIDINEKLAGYFRIPSVAHYLIINPGKAPIIHHQCQADGSILTHCVASGSLTLDPPGLTFDVARHSRLMTPPPRFDDWFRCLFQRPEPLWWNKKIDFTDEYLALDAQFTFKGTDAEVLDLATYTLANCGPLLAGCSDGEVAEGLSMLLNSTNSNLSHQLLAAQSAGGDPLPLIAALDNLYRDIFAKRCSGALGHLSERAGRLNTICYMLWDVTPLEQWGGLRGNKASDRPLIDRLVTILRIPHDACIESALHGLGHMRNWGLPQSDPKSVPSAIDAFLRSTPGLRPNFAPMPNAPKPARSYSRFKTHAPATLPRPRSLGRPPEIRLYPRTEFA